MISYQIWRSVIWLSVLASFLPLAVHGAEESVTRADFANSCATDVQSKFKRAVTFLHSFEYPETARLFAEIIDQDTGCAMARWGAAMSIWHPLWAPPKAPDLRRGADLLEQTNDLKLSARESAYIEALKAFYSSDDTNTHRSRVRAYEQRMNDIYLANLDDPEAAVFYALALLASADPHDKSYTHQFKAAGLLNWVRSSQPSHPGVLHYLIHSYDYPALAHLALDAALVYAEAAPDSAHAQHMPSHIFTRLGMWDRSLASNHDSTKSAEEYTRRAKLPGHYDEGLHSMDYLLYAMLQTARDDEAKKLLGRLSEIRKTDTDNFKVAYTYAAGPARYALERRDWDEASNLQLIRRDFPWEDFGWAKSIHYFARGIGAARSGQVGKARQDRAEIEHLHENLPDTTLPYWREEVNVHLDAVTSWILLSDGEIEKALMLASSAADREDAVDKHPVTPGEVLPARELLADMLLELNKPREALLQYQVVLANSPNRLNSLIGAAESAMKTRDLELADKYASAIRTQTDQGNRNRAGLAAILSRAE